MTTKWHAPCTHERTRIPSKQGGMHPLKRKPAPAPDALVSRAPGCSAPPPLRENADFSHGPQAHYPAHAPSGSARGLRH
eukprot:scaffold7567_cov104-Isochrysis_galbana.AAC.9